MMGIVSNVRNITEKAQGTLNILEISHMNMNIYCEPVGEGVNTVVASVITDLRVQINFIFCQYSSDTQQNPLTFCV